MEMLDDAEISADARRAALAFTAVYLFERRLRTVFVKVLRDRYSGEINQEWLVKVLDAEMLSRALKASQSHLNRTARIVPSEEAIFSFLTLDELICLITNKHWELFSKLFPPLQSLRYGIDLIKGTRNSIAHSRSVTEVEVDKMRSEIGRLLRCLSSEHEVHQLAELDVVESILSDRFQDALGICLSREDLDRTLDVNQLISNSLQIEAVGISLNKLTLNISESLLRRFFANKSQTGEIAKMTLLFLDPRGRFIVERQKEEGYKNNELRNLTKMNIDTIIRKTNDVVSKQEQLEIRLYDVSPRINCIFIDNTSLIAQFYGPYQRGIENPVIFVKRSRYRQGLYEYFRSGYDRLLKDSRLYCSTSA